MSDNERLLKRSWVPWWLWRWVASPEKLATLFLRDGSRVHYYEGRLYISEQQLENKLIVISSDVFDGDYELSGYGPGAAGGATKGKDGDAGR